eukprot:c12016_g2_i1.p1 GENE.c12016_g2_i1~~c12016_g2_i1.p1  ORF type:complete len:629 (+),score=171.72 c12016_g2_i1:174-1889(+)
MQRQYSSDAAQRSESHASTSASVAAPTMGMNGTVRSASRTEMRQRFKAAVVRVGRTQIAVNNMLTTHDSFSILSDRTRKIQAISQLGFVARIRETISRHKEVDQYASVTNIYRPEKIGVYQDMSHPLSHYFISSGHNSYLTGNQFTSRSSVKPIVYALKAGCRVVELDIWNGNTEPKVLHGYTMTKPVGLTKCLRVIRKHAFEVSDYPVIITIENHCNAKNKLVLVKIFQTELGDLIYRNSDAEKWRDFPSPEALRRKILIRDKDDKDDGKDETMQLQVRHSKPTLSRKSSRLWQKKGQHDQEEESCPDPTELRELITIFNLKHSRLARRRAAASSSQAESHLEELHREATDTLKITQRHLVRVYPGGKRVDSSNYDPTLGWSCGAQIVALNWQTPGPQLWVYRGMFSDNGRCGYVLKPEWMLVSEPPVLEDVNFKRMLRVRVLSARHMRHRTIKENFVAVSVFGSPKDANQARTAPVRAYDTCTFDQDFVFPLSCPEIAVVLFTLSSQTMKGEHFHGQVALPVNNMSYGKAQVRLLDKQCERYRKRQRNMSLVLELHIQAATGSIRRLLG